LGFGYTIKSKSLLESFIGEIEPVIKRGELTTAEGQPLIDSARTIINALEDNNSKAISQTEQLNQEIRQGLAIMGYPPGVPASARVPRQLLNSGLLSGAGIERQQMEHQLMGYRLARY
jgi:hypothetical protein